MDEAIREAASGTMSTEQLIYEYLRLFLFIFVIMMIVFKEWNKDQLDESIID